MLEMKIKIEAEDLAAAIAKLADAIAHTDLPAADSDVAQPITDTASAAVPEEDVAQIAPITTNNTTVSAHTSAPAVPVNSTPTYNIDQIATAGAALVNAGKMEQLLALLAKYGVAAITQLKSEQYGGFVTELRALGAQI